MNRMRSLNRDVLYRGAGCEHASRLISTRLTGRKTQRSHPLGAALLAVRVSVEPNESPNRELVAAAPTDLWRAASVGLARVARVVFMQTDGYCEVASFGLYRGIKGPNVLFKAYAALRMSRFDSGATTTSGYTNPTSPSL